MASFWEASLPLFTVLTPLVAAPLTVLTFYLRSIREQQVYAQTTLVRRVERVEASFIDVRRALADVPRDYVAKEEWLRESLHARRLLESLVETVARVEAGLEHLRSTITAGDPTPRADNRENR
jgi:hypothetical protein